MPAVVSERYAFDARVVGVKLFDYLPCAVSAAVVAAHYEAVEGHKTVGGHAVEQREYACRCNRERFFLVVAWDYDCDTRQWR